jgi:hypothetical protein
VQPWKVNNRFVKEGSGSFLKKRTKKLLLAGTWVVVQPPPMAQIKKSLFASRRASPVFLQKKKFLLAF